jgi:hypothetical protein
MAEFEFGANAARAVSTTSLFSKHGSNRAQVAQDCIDA